MKIKEGFVLREVADTIVVVPTGKLLEEYRGMLTLNKSGEFIWKLLESDITEEEIITQLMNQYHIDFDRAKKDMDAFLNALRQKKMIVEN